MRKLTIIDTICNNRLLPRIVSALCLAIHRIPSYPTVSRRLRFACNLDEELPEDIGDVLEISAFLEIREYDYFSLAYRWWFGRVPDSAVLESHFARYMFNRIVPHWVRQYSRMILNLQNEGRLDREDLGISA